MKSREAVIFSWLVVLLLPTFAIYPALTHPIEEHGYDAATFHVYRGVLFSAARAEGMLYPRWSQPINAGLGGPLFSFYPPLTYWAMDALHAVGLSHPLAWRVLVALALWLAATGAFALVLSLSSDALGALVASVVLVYSFPLLRELFERGAPEGFAFALYPWILWSLVRLAHHPSGLRFALAVFSWAVAILTHNLAALFLIPFYGLIALLLVYRHGWRILWMPVLALSCGLLLSAFFLIPFAIEHSNIQIGNALELGYTRVAENAVPLRDWLQFPSPYDLGLDNNLIEDHLGFLSSLIVVCGLGVGPLLWVRGRRWEALVVTALAVFSVWAIWLQIPNANPFWQVSPILAYVQMRTRLMGLAITAIAIVAGFLISAVQGRWRTPLAYGLVVVSVFLALPVLYPQLQHSYTRFGGNPSVRDAVAFSRQENVLGFTAFNEFLPIWRTLPFTSDEAQRVGSGLIANPPQESRIIREERGAAWNETQIESPVPFTATVHVLYFPGWVGYVDDQRRNLKPMAETGYIVLEDIPAGTHTITLRYEGTSVQFIGAWISIVVAVALLLATILWRDKEITLSNSVYLQPRWWLLGVVICCVGLKALWLDPQTTLLRRTSDCSAIQDNGVNVQVRFGTGLVLCGIDLTDRVVEPGSVVRVTLYWETTEVIQEPAETFVHLLGATFNSRTNTPLWGQQNKQLPGYHPVTRWIPGKLYRDRYEFQVAADAPPGEYQLEIGWWQPSPGMRLEPEILHSVESVSISELDSLLISKVVVK